MRRTWTIIGVRDVRGSYRWFRSLLGLPESAPAHDDFGQVLDSDGTVLLCLHAWGAEEHPSLMSPSHAQPGNGLLLFFRVDNFDSALLSARTIVSRLEEEPQVVASAGLGAMQGQSPSTYAVQAVKELGIDISGARSRMIASSRSKSGCGIQW